MKLTRQNQKISVNKRIGKVQLISYIRTIVVAGGRHSGRQISEKVWSQLETSWKWDGDTKWEADPWEVDKPFGPTNQVGQLYLWGGPDNFTVSQKLRPQMERDFQTAGGETCKPKLYARKTWLRIDFIRWLNIWQKYNKRSNMNCPKK